MKIVILLLAILNCQVAFGLRKLTMKADYCPINEKISGLNTYRLIDYTLWLQEDRPLNISFELPETLTGVRQKGNFVYQKTATTDKGKVHHFKGNLGELRCFGKWSNAKCSVSFENLQFDYVRLYELNQKDKSRNLVLIAKHFSEEPLGIAVIKGVNNRN